MKRIFALLFLIAVAAVSQAQISPTAVITGNALGIVGASTTIYPITLSAQVVGCGPQVPLIIGGIGGSVITNTYKTVPLVGPSFIATLTVYGNDVISCGGQTYTMYAVTWLINNQPAAPTASYRVVQGQTCNISDGTCLPVGFVPPVIGAGAGLICPAAFPLLSGFNANYTPVCLVGPVVSVPNALQITPAASQVLTQPVNTNLDFNLSGTGLFRYNGGTVLTSNSGNVIFTTPSGAQTITEPVNANLNIVTSGTGVFNYNGNQVLNVTTGVRFAPSAAQTITQPANTNFNVVTSGGGIFVYNGTQVLNAATGVQFAPAVNQSVTQPLGTTLAINSLNGVFNEELFSGGTVNARIVTAITACSTNPCLIEIPVNAPTGLITTIPPANVILQDQRFINGTGFAANAQPNLRSSFQLFAQNAANASYESGSNSGNFIMDLEQLCTAGGTAHNASSANCGGLLLFTDRTAGNRPTWGADLNFQYANLNNTSTGLEIDSVNNSGTGDPGDGTVGSGIKLIASGTANNGVGLLIQGSGASWTSGSIIQNFIDRGIFISAGIARANPGGTSSDIFIVPPDNTLANCSIEVTGSNCSGALFAVRDNGQVVTQQGYSAGGQTGITHTTTVPCTGTMVFTGGILTSTTGTC